MSATPDDLKANDAARRSFAAPIGSASERRYPHKAHVLGWLCLTTCNQGQGAPLIDKCYTQDKEGRYYIGVAILLQPWKRNKYGESLPQRCLVIAKRQNEGGQP